MKLIPLSDGTFAKVDDADFPMLANYTWQALHKGKGKLVVRTTLWDRETKKRISVPMHQMIMNRRWNDHINRDQRDNQRSNLRPCNKINNTHNRGPRKHSSQFKGVCWVAKKWRVQIKANGKTIYIGRFSNEIEAAKAYDSEAIRLHREFAYLNFPLASK